MMTSRATPGNAPNRVWPGSPICRLRGKAIIACAPLPTGCRRLIVTRSKSRTTNSAGPRLRLGLLLLAVQLGVAGCGGDNLLLPSSGQPAKISVLSGNGQIDTVGQQLELPIVIAVTDPGNRPVEGVEIALV